MLDANFALGLDEVDEDLLVVLPVLDDVSFWREQSTKTNIVLKFIVQTVGELVLVQDLLDEFVVLHVVL